MRASQCYEFGGSNSSRWSPISLPGGEAVPEPGNAEVDLTARGVQYLTIRYTKRLAEASAMRSIGSRGGSYDNALAETVMGLDKVELIHRRGPWTRPSWPPPSGWTGGISAGSTAPPSVCRRPSTSAGSGSRRRPRLPDPALHLQRDGLGVSRPAPTRLFDVAVLAFYVSLSPLRSGTSPKALRFLYHRQREATAVARIQAAESSEGSSSSLSRCR